MNDLPWIKYEPKLMFIDTLGMSFAGKVAHRQLCDYIWMNDVPPPHREAALRDIASCGALSAEEWAGVMTELQDHGWVVVGGFFLHRAAIATLNESKQSYAAEYNKTSRLNGKECVLSEPDSVTGCVRMRVTSPVTSGDPKRGRQRVTPDKEQSQEQVQKGTSVHSQTSQSTPKVNGTKLTFSMLGRMANELAENKWGWHYDNHKLKPESLVPAGLVATLRPFVDRLTERQVREAWAEAALKTHQAAVDGMRITHSLAHYAVGIWREEMEKLCPLN
jgi:hypothetical protein